jgi:hypothetical protein
MTEWYENEKFIDVLGKGISFGQKQFELQQKQKFQEELARQKMESDYKKMQLSNDLKMRQYMQKFELDKQREEYRARNRAQEAEEMNEINFRALEKMKGLGYSVNDASKIIGMSRGRKMYSDTDAYDSFQKRYKMNRSEPSVPKHIEKRKKGKKEKLTKIGRIRPRK